MLGIFKLLGTCPFWLDTSTGSGVDIWGVASTAGLLGALNAGTSKLGVLTGILSVFTGSSFGILNAPELNVGISKLGMLFATLSLGGLNTDSLTGNSTFSSLLYLLLRFFNVSRVGSCNNSFVISSNSSFVKYFILGPSLL